MSLAAEQIPLSLETFLQTWVMQYKQAVASIPLFDTVLTAQFSPSQKIFFAKAFYHARGHFHDFLWYMGNTAPNIETKNIILQNIGEEFGGYSRSHEALYLEFAKSVGADLSQEIIEENTYLPEIKAFNKGHLAWLHAHSWHSNVSAFAAYEKLDNIDYVNLLQLAKSFQLRNTDIVFFSVHVNVAHFETALSEISTIWDNTPTTVIEAFDFIGQHQITMWRNLSTAVFNYA